MPSPPLHDVAARILRRYDGAVWFGLLQFSPKWLTYYRPVWLVGRLLRKGRLARFLETIGLLPTRFYKIAHFDADHNFLLIYEPRAYQAMRQAADFISAAIGVEVSVIRKWRLQARDEVIASGY